MRLGHRRATAIAAIAVAIAGAACNGVLGLDAPRLDPCANGCTDGAIVEGDAAPGVIDGAVLVDATPPPSDAPLDQGPIVGVRCGGGSTPAIGCGPSTPVCCVDIDGGTASYTCDTEAAACEGYPVLCATNNDCTGNDVCCHYGSAIKCEGETVCANNSLVCEPGGPSDQCPTGWKCIVAFTSGSYTLPYYGCSP